MGEKYSFSPEKLTLPRESEPCLDCRPVQDPEVAEAAQYAGAVAERDLVDAPGLGGEGEKRLREFSLMACTVRMMSGVSQNRLWGVA